MSELENDTSIDAVAVIGMAGRFPGAGNVAQFWRNLRDGVESISFFSEEELLAAGVDPGVLKNPDCVKARGVLEGVDLMDAAFFGLTPREAEVMDPQHRLFLECAWEALEDAGCDPERYPGAIGVFAGLSMNTYLLHNLCADREFIERLVVQHQLGAFSIFLGNDKDFLPTRVSYKLNLKGPSLNIQTACSTSLVTVHQACRSLLSLECQVALAGGVSISFPQQRGYFYQEGGMGSPDGHCRAFDERAQGVAFGGGVGLVVLKRLEEALADGDQVYAVIRGSAINNDGASKVSYTAPSVDAQADVIALAQALAGTPAETITYIEAHGTGTPLGDPIEVAALTKAFRVSTAATGFCALGSVKSNVGHLESAAGVTGLIKTVLALQHRMIPPSLHFEKPSPRICFDDSPFYVNAKLAEWKRGPTPRRAGVSAFGVGGTNAHVVLEEPPAPLATTESRPQQLILLSAKTPAALNVASRNLGTFLSENPEADVRDVAFTLQVGRRAFEHRQFLVAAGAKEAAETLSTASGGRIPHGLARDPAPGIAFAFPGQGAQFAGMGGETYLLEPVFRTEIDRCAEILRPLLGFDIRRLLYPKDDEREDASRRLCETALTQPALFLVEYALAKLWISWGVRPEAMIGHSIGEYVAACLAEVFPLEAALHLVAARGRLMQGLPRGAMLAVRLSEEDVLASLPTGLALAAVNGPSLCVVSGPTESVEAYEKEMTARDVICRALATSHAFHSPMMEPILDAFVEEVRKVPRQPPRIPFVSTLTGTWITPAEATDPSYWARQLRQTVRFAPAAQELIATPNLTVLEVGPGTTLVTLITQLAGKEKGRVLVSSFGDSRRGRTENEGLLEALGQLWLTGVSPDWGAFYQNERRRRVSLPTYPFERQRFWVEPRKIVAEGQPVASRPQEESRMPKASAEADRTGSFVRAIQTLFGDLSGLTPADIDPDSTFLDLGLDSLFLTQAAQNLQKTFRVKVTFRQLLSELSTPRRLAEHIEQHAPADALPSAAPEMTAAVSLPPMGPQTGASQLEILLTQQLKVMTQFMTQQLDALRAAPPPATSVPIAAATIVATDSSRQAFKPFGPFKPLDKGKVGDLAAQQARYLADLIQRYTKRTSGSKNLVQADRPVLADPRVAAGFRAQWKELVYPIVTNRAEGSRLWDVDGNEYIDILNGFGCIMFGHSPGFVTEALSRQLREGMEIGPQTALAGRAARLICELTGNERAAFCNTGSEAVMAALRVARTVTGRSKVAVFSGAYHGMFDEVLVKAMRTASGVRAAPIAPGIPSESVENMLVLEYGTSESLDILKANMKELAAVLVEPVQSRRPDLQPREFLREVRRLSEEAGTALIFDEVVTGFRVHPGGMQAVFGIRADMATYGKVIGGGMPIGVLAGKAAFMDALDGGQWRYGDDSFPEVGVTFFAGTFVRHPLTLAAVNAVLDHLKDSGPALQFMLNQRAARFVATLNAFFDERGVPLHIRHCGSFMYFHLPSDQRFGSLLYYYLRLRGVHIQEGFPCFLTTAHTEADLAAVIKAFKETIVEMQDGGFLPAAADAQLSGFEVASAAADAPKSSPTTEAQKEIFLACQMGEEAACAYNDSLSVRLRGALQVEALRSSIQALLVQHNALCSRFSVDGKSFAVVDAQALDIPLVDISQAKQDEREAEYARIVAAENLKPFDLVTGPLLRAIIVRLGEAEHRLLLMAHHIVCDGWSFVVLLQDLALLYNTTCYGIRGELPQAMPFTDYARWEADRKQTKEYASAEAYWLQEFSETVPPLQLPTDRPRPPVRTYRAGLERILIDAELFKAVRRLGAKSGCTQFTTILAAFMVLLHRLAGQEDVVVAVPAAGQSVIGEDELVGHCANLLPVRGRPVASKTFSSFLAEMKRTVMDAYEHQSYTYGTLVHKLSLPRDPSRHPLLSAMFNIDRAGFKGLELAGLKTDLVTNPKASVIFDLNFNIIETDLGLELNCDYKTDLFDAETIHTWLKSFRALLSSIVADPEGPLGTLAILTEQQKHEVLEEGTRTGSVYPEVGIHELIAAQAARTPEVTAAACGERQWSYCELEERANRIAGHLLGLGVGAGSLVAVYVERSLEMLAALLGVMKSGGAYVPLDPSFPAERIALVLDDAGAEVVLTEEALLPTLHGRRGSLVCLDRDWPKIEDGSLAGPGCTGSPDQPAYVIYTSGSTGKPKGVQVTHRGVVNFLTSMMREPGFTAADTLLAVTTISFDIAGLELFLPLMAGGRVVIAEREETWDGNRMVERLESCGATVMQATPATWRLLLEASWTPKRPIKMLCGGEALPRDLAEQLLDRCPELWNMYGPTETTIWSTVARVARGAGPIPLGLPIDNTQLYIVDANMQPTAPGAPGELLIGGDGVALGYLNRPELTAEKFGPDPFSPDPDARVYRTGDLVRRRHDGELLFLGRLDNQVKVRGFRIELSEIETVLHAHAAVQENVVLAREDMPGEKRLVAYVVPATKGDESVVPALRAYLTGKLPPYMVPSAFVLLEALPRTPNGKIDRRALAAPGERDFVSGKEFLAPRSPAEHSLAGIWASVLHLDRISVDDSVFDLGADSLMIFQISARARQSGLPVTPGMIFEYRTVGEIVKKMMDAPVGVAPAPILAAVSRDAYRRKRSGP